ncbi:hypothetical protein B0T16DRAFT_386373 [Cercophora newfieldiana]|uniref:Clr5 domain-containing protein n=1 Tax=Cercophora newfieldiana TaxID=92897 RepID=A0AA39YTY3_9PEZI|nr:hypothetical protein B0T16DRAFT_386373 [Cercophora newfieldiana]
MSAPGGDIHFVNAPAAYRTARIPAQKWEEHRAEIVHLYLNSNLGEVAVQMRARHNFHPTEPQYVYQLRRWGVRKQGVANKAAATVTAHPALPNNSVPVLGQGALKRNRATANADNISISSAESALAKPPRKKHLESPRSGPSILNNPPSTGDSNTELHSRGTSTERDLPAESPVTHDCRPEESREWPLATSPPISGGTPDTTLASSPWTPVPSQSNPTQPPTGDTPSYERHDEGDIETLNNTPSPGSREGEPGLRTIDRNRPVDTFSNQDMDDIRSAADYFAAVGCDQIAFQLYITFLKRQRWKAKGRASPPKLWYLIVQCAHTATNPEHVVIIQNIITEEMNRLPRHYDASSTSMHRFILQMLLAFIFHRNPPDSHQGPESHHSTFTGAAWLDAGADELSLFEYLPRDDRSLDLALYRSILRLYAGELDTPAPEPPDTSNSDATLIRGWQSENRLELDSYILRHAPGPFEMRSNHGVSNSCIRSCLRWSKDQLHGMESLQIRPPYAGGRYEHDDWHSTTLGYRDREQDGSPQLDDLTVWDTRFTRCREPPFFTLKKP